MSILFPHNQKAYEAALSLMKETGRACVIHPTGTGKSFIGFQLCADFPEERVLWLSPSEYIFRTQLENWKDAGGTDLANIHFVTYAKLALLSQEELSELQPALIILDEFHRAGAEQWGAAVKRLLALYPPTPRKPAGSTAAGDSGESSPHSNSSPAGDHLSFIIHHLSFPCALLGLSATNIRYLDNQRDMAMELFDGCIASEMTLSEAIVRGILSAPKYVLSVFRYQQSLEKYELRIRRTKSKAARDEAERTFEKLRRALENATGLPEIFEKHLPDRTGKYLVFCSDAEHMDEMMQQARTWFSGIDASPHFYRAYSEDPSTSEAFSSFKADTSAHLKLLFCIDMLNEGIHVPDVSGVILLRPTVSPIVYKQQIGRALSATGSRHPVIFDIVLNIENLYSISTIQDEITALAAYYRSLGLGSEVVNDSFTVIDEVHDCLELFDRLNDALTASWDSMYAQAKRYYTENGDLEVPRRYVTAEGYSLGSWLDTQRRVYNGSIAGGLTPERIRLLDGIGMCWDSASDRSWNRYYEACKAYASRHGDLLVPRTYITHSGMKLGRWICNLRSLRKSGRRNAFLSEDRIAALDALGMQWDVPDYLFERNYYSAVAYHQSHGDLNVHAGYVDDNGVRLGQWIANLRHKFHTGSLVLTEEQTARLNALGMRWKTPSELAWEQGISEAKSYTRIHGTLDAPFSYVSPSGFRLGNWLSRCREKYASGKLNASRVSSLESLGITWSLRPSASSPHPHASR